MTSFWKFFIEKNHFTILLAIVLSLAGWYAVVAIPKESSPEVQIPVGIITTVLPGAGAEDVERLITDKIEDRVIGLARVSRVTSTSGESVSSITVEFDAQANLKDSIQLLKDEVDKVKPELPSEAEDPSVTDVNFADQPILIASISGNLTPPELTALGQTIQNEIERIPGVSSVSLSGVRNREVSVIVAQEKLLQYGITLSDITSALRISGIASPIGEIVTDNVQYSVRLEAGITTPSEVGLISIQGPGGVSLRVQDVAEVVDGLEDPRTFSRVSVAGNPSEPALTLSVYKNRGGNIIQTGKDILTTLEELKKTTLAGTSVVVSYDAADDIAHDLSELTKVGIETVVLVMLMLFLTLGWRESLTAGMSIPLSFLIAFIGIAASGNTINFISLFSLILAIGILVDSGIVIVEAFHTRLIMYKDKKQAAVAAIKEYAWPLIAGTVTTIAVFVPLFFLSGIVGKFISSIPFTVIFVLGASIFVALGLIPLLAIYAIRPELSRMEQIQERWNHTAKEWYKDFLRKILSNKKSENKFLIGIVVLFIVSLALPMTGLVKSIFFPTEDMGLLYIDVEKPQGTPLSETDLSTREVEEYLYGDARISSFVTEVGSRNAFSGVAGGGAKIANITVNLIDEKERKESSQEIMADLREKLSPITSAKVNVLEPAGGPPVGKAFSATFSGDDLGLITESVEKAERMLKDIPGALNVTTSTRNDSPEFSIHLDTGKAAEQGVSLLSVSDTLRTALFGTKATTIRTNGTDIEVTTKLNLNPNYIDPSETRNVSIDSIRALLIPSIRGPIPLESIATIEYNSAQSSIAHTDGNRTATIEADVGSGSNPIVLTQEFNAKLQNLNLPEEITVKIGGETEDVNQSFAEMGIALLAGLALMLAVLVLEFNSFRHSFYLLSVIPLSLIGVLFGLMITGQPLSFPSMLGIIALAGVIINHAIILMDSIARIGRERVGQSLVDVVVEASATRFRPIILTTVTTVVGMIPLSFASSLWGPLASSIMFGLSFSMVLTLVLIPVLYHRWPGKKVREQFPA